MKLKDLRQPFFEYKSKRTKPSTIMAYMNAIDQFILPYFEDDIDEGINNKQINKFAEYLIENGRSVKYAMDIKTILGTMLNFANTMYDIPLHRWNISWPTPNTRSKNKMKFFTKDECKKIFDLMEAEPDPRLLGLVIGLTTGLRIGEICGLRFIDVDFDNKIIHVQRTVERIYHRGMLNAENVDVAECSYSQGCCKSTKVIISKPKTIHSDRQCPLAKIPLKWLKKYAAVSTPDSYILTLKPYVLEPRTYRNYYYRILDLLGLPRLNPHSMRHTFATQMLHNKVDVATIASILGHSSPAITLGIYSHTNEEEKAKAVNNVFGKMFKKNN